jgi:hypothetical protein
MKITLQKLHTSSSITNEEATRLCQIALELKDRADYAGAQKTMSRFWSGVSDPPKTEGLHPSVAAEVVLCVGILTSWIGFKNQIQDAQETAKNLITESITYFDSMGDVTRIAAARTEIAYCYWREGELSEARRNYQGESTLEVNNRRMFSRTIPRGTRNSNRQLCRVSEGAESYC